MIEPLDELKRAKVEACRVYVERAWAAYLMLLAQDPEWRNVDAARAAFKIAKDFDEVALREVAQAMAGLGGP